LLILHYRLASFDEKKGAFGKKRGGKWTRKRQIRKEDKAFGF
jgi:hypothetical protein